MTHTIENAEEWDILWSAVTTNGGTMLVSDHGLGPTEFREGEGCYYVSPQIYRALKAEMARRSVGN